MNCKNGVGNPDPIYIDENENYEYWANVGESEIYPGYMFEYYKRICDVCLK